MSEEIRTEFRVSPHRTVNSNATFDHITLTNNLVNPFGVRFRNGEIADLILWLPIIPPEIHATTPNGKIRVLWTTSSSDVVNAVKFFLDVKVVASGGTVDPAAWDFSTTTTDTSDGAGLLSLRTIDLTALALPAGNSIIARLRRDSGDAADLLGSDVLILGALFVADKA